MAEVTVKQFAEVVGISIDRLLEQLQEAGLEKEGADANLTDSEKMELLGHLRRKHGKEEVGADGGPKKVTLNRKSTSELKLSGSHGKGKSVTVEVRKKRTYIKRSVVLEKETERVESERAQREEVEAEQKRLEDEAKRKVEEKEAQRKAEEEAIQKAVEERKAAEEEAERKKTEEETRGKKTEAAATTPAPAKENKEARKGKKTRKEEQGDRGTRYGREELHVTADKSGRRKKKKRSHMSTPAAQTEYGFTRPTAPIVHEVLVPETISVADLAQRMSVKAAEVIKVMMKMGTMATINQDRKSTRLNSSHIPLSRMPSSA